jgi:hypothetical protein
MVKSKCYAQHAISRQCGGFPEVDLIQLANDRKNKYNVTPKPAMRLLAQR